MGKLEPSTVTTALLLGGANSLHADMDAATTLFQPDLIIATNDAGRDWPRKVDHWVSFHCEQFPRWLKEREKLGHPAGAKLWTGQRRGVMAHLDIERVPNWGGSSGLLAVAVGLEVGVDHMVLCGIPLTPEGEHYNKPGRWTDAGNYRRGWLTHKHLMGNHVRSMSGWTRQQFGAPTQEWLACAVVDPIR